MNRKLLVSIVLDILFIFALLLTSCGGKTDTGTSTAGEDDADLVGKTEKTIGSLSDIDIDLSESTLDDFDVPIADISIPDVEVGSLDLDLDFDVSSDIPDLTVPDVAGALPEISLDSLPGSSSGGVTVNDEICRQFENVPDCSYVPEQYRDLCEECKKQN